VATVVERAAACSAQAIVITGGEPLLYPLGILTRDLHARGLEIFLETSGTQPLSGEFDWVCLSPKRQLPPLEEAFRRADELKVIIQTEEDIAWAVECSKRVGRKCRLYLQPEWSVYERITPTIVEWVKQNPEWNISIQAHKFMNIP
jgi:organic radical activating enzyme